MQARKSVNYAESDDDEDDVLGPIANNSRARTIKRRRVSVEDDSDDEFGWMLRHSRLWLRMV